MKYFILMENSTDIKLDIVNWELISSQEIDSNWIPYTNWLRFRFDNDGVIIVTNLRTGSSLFMNLTAGLTLKLCNGKLSVDEIANGIQSKYLNQEKDKIIQDVKNILYANMKVGNIIIVKC